MKLSFSKYQGAGNDFIIIDNRKPVFDKTDSALIARLCNRRFGIGADGLMLLENKTGYDFEMIYFNADGGLSSLCGNGSRCIVRFSQQLGVTGMKARFLASDGPHEAILQDQSVKLKMGDISAIESGDDFFYLNTGSPHYVKMVKGLATFDVFREGRTVRNSERFMKEGTNVNFIEKEGETLFVRTYERGVEDETLACGTGVTASALIAAVNGLCEDSGSCAVRTPGGKLKVYYKRTGISSFTDVWLEGPAEKVFEGVIEF